ncbi:MAG: tetratricopeptide repeat protein [Chloroflexi bacterium]|nr:tetratricopeptide repeat protein [Chloroflexota bacterium]
MADEIGYQQQTLTVYGHQNLATLYVRIGRFDLARAYAEKGLRLAQEAEDIVTVSTLNSTMGTIEACCGDYGLAEAHYKVALKGAREAQVSWIVSGVLIERGKAFFTQEKWDRGAACFRESLGIAKELEHQEFIAEGLYGLARAAAARDNVREARQQGMEALAIFEELGHRDVDEVRRWLDDISDRDAPPTNMATR